MKKICFLLSIILMVTPLLFACEDDSDENNPKTEMTNLTSGFDEYYTNNQLSCWQDVAAIYSAKLDINKYNYASALEKAETLSDKAGYVISVSLLSKQENDVSTYKVDDFKLEIIKVIESEYKDKTVKELALCFFAMTASKTECNFEEATKYLESLQNKNGGFPISSGYAISDVESSAYALNIITLSRRYISDNCYDSVVVYLGQSINNNNTLSDIDGKQSAASTALALNSLISANIPLNGEVSTALTTAINKNFKSESGSALIGYKKYADDTNVNKEVTAEVHLCFAATTYGNLWVNLFSENNAD